jgi:hypothetical protein
MHHMVGHDPGFSALKMPETVPLTDGRRDTEKLVRIGQAQLEFPDKLISGRVSGQNRRFA